MMQGLPKIGLEAVLADANFRAGFSNYMKGVDQMIAKTGVAQGSLTGQFAHLGGAVLSFGAVALKALAIGTAAGASAIAGLGAASLVTAKSFESAWTGVVKTTDGLVDSTGNLTSTGAALQSEFRELAKTTPIAVEELLRIGELGGQLGIAKDQLVGFSDTIAALGVSTNLSTEEAATAFAQLANIMGTTQTYGDQAFERMGSAVVGLGNNFATTERDIVSFAQRIAGAGKIAGLSEADIFGIGAAFASVGVEAEAGGTAIQKTLIDMNTAVAQGTNKINPQLDMYAKVAGMSAKEFEKAWKEDAAGAFTSFVAGLGASGDEAVLLLEKLGLTDARLTRGFLSVAGAGDLMSNAISLSNKEFEKSTALQEEAGRRYATTDSKIQMVKNQFRDLGVTVGMKLLPVFNNFLDIVSGSVIPALGTFVEYISKVIATGNILNGSLAELPGPLQGVAVAIGSIVSAASRLLAGDVAGAMTALGIPPEVQEGIFAFAQTVSDFVTKTLIPFVQAHLPELQGALIGIGAVLAGATIVAGVLAIAGAIAGLMNPITLIIAGAALLGAAWAGNWGGIQEKTQAVIDFIRPYIEGFLSAIQTFWNEHGATILQTVLTMWEGIKAHFDTFTKRVRMVFDLFRFAFEGKWEEFGQKLREIWDTAWNDIKTAAETAWNAIKEGVSTLITNIIKLFTETDWGKVGNDIVQGIATGITGAVDWIMKAVEGVGAAAIAAIRGFLGIASPSKVFYGFGRDTGLGLALGIEDYAYLAANAAARSGALVASAFNSQIGAMDTINSAVERARFGGRLSVPAGAPIGGRPSSIVNNTQNVNLTINPTYEQYQSPADVYYDARAALAAARL